MNAHTDHPATDRAASWEEREQAAPPRTGGGGMARVLTLMALVSGGLVWGISHFDVPANLHALAEPAKPAPVQKPAPPVRAEEKAELLAVTEGEQASEILAKGDVAKAQNALIPLSSAPVEATRPFVLPAISANASRAELCLTQAVYYEAGFEPEAGKRAVAQVVLNRMRHPAFPKSVCGVVYQGSQQPVCQFSFTCDGSLGRVPATGAWARARQVARAALAGHVEKWVGTATHYHANYVLPKWAPKLAKITQIGAHIFYRWPGNWGRRQYFNASYAGAEYIPAFDPSQPVEELAAADMLPPDPTDRRAPNDVGGRLDVSKGWTLNIPDPTTSPSRYGAVTDVQVAMTGAATHQAGGME